MPVLVSVIIPSLNSPVIDRALAAVRAQDFDLAQVEVLVVGKDEPGLVEEDGLVRLIDMGRPRSAAANRNAGIAAARGQILCFTDSDCMPAPDWLTRLTAPLLRGEAQVVGGGIAFDADNYWTLCDNISWFYQSLAEASPGERYSLPSLNLGMHRAVIEAVGLFDERYAVSGEDMDWTARARGRGYALHFEPRAVVKHAPERGSFGQIWRHAYDFGLHTPKMNEGDSARRDSEYRFLPSGAALVLLSPLLASLVTARIVARHWRLPQVWIAIPGVWLSKVAWCLGAARVRRNRRTL